MIVSVQIRVRAAVCGRTRVTVCAREAASLRARLAPPSWAPPLLARSLLPGRKLQGRGQMVSSDLLFIIPAKAYSV